MPAYVACTLKNLKTESIDGRFSTHLFLGCYCPSRTLSPGFFLISVRFRKTKTKQNMRYDTRYEKRINRSPLYSGSALLHYCTLLLVAPLERASHNNAGRKASEHPPSRLTRQQRSEHPPPRPFQPPSTDFTEGGRGQREVRQGSSSL